MGRGRLILVLVVLVVAGCNGGPGNRTPEPIEATASEATVTESALSETGFTETASTQTNVTRSGTLSIAGDVEMDLGYQIQATAWRTVYHPSDTEETVFSLYTVPLAEPERVDVRIDPLGDATLPAIVSEAQPTYQLSGNLSHVQNRTVTILNTETTVQEFETTATTGNSTTKVTIYVTRIDHEADRIRAVAVTPRDANTWDTLRPLFENITH